VNPAGRFGAPVTEPGPSGVDGEVMRIPFHTWYCLTIVLRAGASRQWASLAAWPLRGGTEQARPQGGCLLQEMVPCQQRLLICSSSGISGTAAGQGSSRKATWKRCKPSPAGSRPSWPGLTRISVAPDRVSLRARVIGTKRPVARS